MVVVVVVVVVVDVEDVEVEVVVKVVVAVVEVEVEVVEGKEAVRAPRRVFCEGPEAETANASPTFNLALD